MGAQMDDEEIRNWILLGGFSVVFTIALAFLALGPGLDWALGKAVDRLPLNAEEKLGGKLFDALVKAQANDDPALAAVLKRCAKPLAEPGEERKYQVLVVEDAQVNAFALPGGSLVLHRGLLDKLQDESELFGVLGHEAGHVRKRHFLKRLARAAGLGVGFAILLGDTSGILAVLADGSQELLLKGYGRAEETAADDIGLATLKRLKLDPHGMPRLMLRLQEAEGKDGVTVPELLSSHPATLKRRVRLEERLKGVPARAEARILSAEDWAVLKRKGKPAKDRNE